ncbi:Homeobox [Gracilaria domingensis]|nr:Homeobox [Gracilaria domingensis]
MAHHQPPPPKLSHVAQPLLPPPSQPPPLLPPTTPDLSAPLASASTPTLGATALLVTASPTTPALSTSPAPPVVTFAPVPAAAPVTLSAQPLPQPTHSKWRVTPAQKEVLLKAFDEEPYPELHKKNTLAHQLGVTTAQISKWFQHRREHLTRLGQFKAQYNRTRRTPEELDVLQAAFDADRYPTAERLQQLANQLQGVTPKQIKLWFKHRRKQDQKRRRSNSSPISLRSSPSLPSHSMQPGLRSMRPVDLSPSSHDPTRPDWRTTLPTNLVPNVQQCQQLPHPTLMQTPSASNVPYSFDAHQYYRYKQHQFLVSQSPFSKAELLALQAVQTVLNSIPPPDAIAKLAQLLNKPHDAIRDWFRSQDSVRMSDPTTAAASQDSQQNALMQSPIMQVAEHTIRQSTTPKPSLIDSHSPSTLHDLRKIDNDISMSEKSSKMVTEDMKPQSTREVDAHKEFGTLDDKQCMDASLRTNAPREAASAQNNVVPNVGTGIYPTYVYPNSVVDGGLMVQHQPAPFQQAQASSTPTLAPLRFVPSTSSGAPYIAQNAVWYHAAPNLQPK